MALALPVVVLALVVIVARVVSGRRAVVRTVTLASPELQTIARMTGRSRLAGVAVGVVVGVVAAYQGGLGRGLLLAAPLGALCILAGVLTGELLVAVPRGPVRQAELTVRRIRDYVPPALGSAVVAAGALLAVILGLTTATGSPDDMGRAGRQLVRRCSAVMTEGAGAWPGSYYAYPLGIVVLLGLLAAGVVLARVVRRPRSIGDRAVDDALRRSAARAVTAAVGLLIAVPLAGVSAVAGSALVNIDCRPAWWTVAALGLAVSAVASLALAAASASALLAPARQDARLPVPVDR